MKNSNLINIEIGDSVTYFKESIDLRNCCTLNKSYKVIGFEQIMNRKHIIIIDDINEQLFIPLTSNDWN